MTLWSWQLLMVLAAPAVGSFLGVLVERLPRGQSLLGRSRCAACGAALGARDLVPVLSALALRGRCRTCGAAIPSHLLRIEIAALAAGLLAAATSPGPGEMLLVAAYLWCLIALFYCDLLYLRLPDALTAALFALGLGLAAADPARSWAEALLSAAIGSAAFLAIRIGYRRWRGREGLGLGDVKLMAGIGAALGWPLLPVVTLLAAAMGLAAAAAQAARARAWPAGTARLPMGSYLCGAAALVLLWRQLGLALPGQF